MRNKGIIIVLVITAILLLIPLIAMQFTDEVNWTLGDFIVAGVVLLETGLLYELVLRKLKKTHYRIAFFGALLIALLLVWAELAVGIF